MSAGPGLSPYCQGSESLFECCAEQSALKTVFLVNVGRAEAEPLLPSLGKPAPMMRRAIRTLALEGNNIIIDDIILNQTFLDDYLHVMTEQPLYFVGVRCPLSVIEQRESQRLGRFPGTAESHFTACHAHGVYDVEVDTSTASPEACAERIVKRIAAGPPRAFSQLAG